VWQHRGSKRPPFADEPAEGQESVWDYPRPPVMRPDSRHVVVRHRDIVIANTTAAVRVLETASPPTFYLPEADVATALLLPSHTRATYCEWKGTATYFDLIPESPGATRSPEPPSRRYPTTSASIRAKSSAMSMANACAHSPEASMAAG
jgi:uncharacterized protein (DUF427 family)